MITTTSHLLQQQIKCQTRTQLLSLRNYFLNRGYNMKFTGCLIFVACSFVGALAVDEGVQRANAFIDDFIAKATSDTGGFIDPLTLDELGKSFEREVGFVKMTGEARLYDGKMYGLSSMQRKGNAVVLDLDDMLIIYSHLSFKKLQAFYRGTVQVNELGPKFTMNAKIGGSNVSMILTVTEGSSNATLLNFKINQLKDIRISIFGLGAMGWTASIISTLALNALEKQVATLASAKIHDYFSKEIEKVPYPWDSPSISP